MEKMLKADAIDERRRFLLDVGMPSGEVDKVLQSSLKEQVELVQDLVEKKGSGVCYCLLYMFIKLNKTIKFSKYILLIILYLLQNSTKIREIRTVPPFFQLELMV